MKYRDGEPCSHPGCCNHVTHPCEWCGRIQCRTETLTSCGQVDSLVMRKQKLKKEIDKILIDALGGHKEKYRYQDRFVRWGAVGQEIHLKIDEAFKDLSA